MFDFETNEHQNAEQEVLAALDKLMALRWGEEAEGMVVRCVILPVVRTTGGKMGFGWQGIGVSGPEAYGLALEASQSLERDLEPKEEEEDE